VKIRQVNNAEIGKSLKGFFYFESGHLGRLFFLADGPGDT